MVGYAFGNKVGAKIYNFFHHLALGIAVYFWGLYLINNIIEFIGIILFAHSSMDRTVGYGIKYATGFQDTHLGKIEKSASK